MSLFIFVSFSQCSIIKLSLEQICSHSWHSNPFKRLRSSIVADPRSRMTIASRSTKSSSLAYAMSLRRVCRLSDSCIFPRCLRTPASELSACLHVQHINALFSGKYIKWVVIRFSGCGSVIVTWSASGSPWFSQKTGVKKTGVFFSGIHAWYWRKQELPHH